MRYTILTKGDSKSNALKHKMMNYMKDFRMIEDSENPEIVISVGGDGTLLQAFHQYSHMLSKVAFVGVHTGHLGFYADWLPHEVEKLIIEINNSEFQVIEGNTLSDLEAMDYVYQHLRVQRLITKR